MELIKQNELQKAANILAFGGLIAFPTETVFGLGVVFDNSKSYKKLIEVKRRPPDKPFTLMCSDVNEIEHYAEVNEIAKALINAYMPGQFTIILKAKEGLPEYVVSKEGNVGIRISGDENVRKLIKLVGKPLLVPSANKSGEQPLTNSKDVEKVFSEEIDAVIEGESNSNIPSTIVLVDNGVHILREGIIKESDINKLLGGK